MYARKADGKELRFGHSGILFRNAFMIYDKAAGSQWLHFTGQALTGPYRGKRLEYFPSHVTTWAKWKALYPRTRVAVGTMRSGFMGTYRGAKSLSGLGMALLEGKDSKMYAFEHLRQSPVVNDTFHKAKVLVVFFSSTGSGRAWNRVLKGQELHFQPHGNDTLGRPLMRDTETDSLWLAMKGEAVEGRLEGARLDALPTTTMLMVRWRAFYPDGARYAPSSKERHGDMRKERAAGRTKGRRWD